MPYHMMFMVDVGKSFDQIIATWAPKWWFSKGNPRLFQEMEILQSGPLEVINGVNPYKWPKINRFAWGYYPTYRSYFTLLITCRGPTLYGKSLKAPFLLLTLPRLWSVLVVGVHLVTGTESVGRNNSTYLGSMGRLYIYLQGGPPTSYK